MKNYNKFISESLRDKMVSKSVDDIKTSLENKYKTKIQVLFDLLDKKLISSYDEIYTLEELKDDLKEKLGSYNMIDVIKDLLNREIITSPFDIYTKEEIERYLKTRIPMYMINSENNKIGNPLDKFYPNDEQIIRLFKLLKDEPIEKKNNSILIIYKFFKEQYDIEIFDYIDINKLQKELKRKKEQN